MMRVFQGGDVQGDNAHPWMQSADRPRLVSNAFSCPTFRRVVPSLLFLRADDTAEPRQAELPQRQAEP